MHQGELKELGRVDSLLTWPTSRRFAPSGLSPDSASEEIRQVIERHQGELVSIEHPTTTLEELFLSIVRDSEARPGRRRGRKISRFLESS